MRYLLDEDLNPAVAEILRAQGMEAISVHEMDRRGFSDERQLRFAAAQERVLVTRNRDDFIRLTVRFFHTASPHFGVLIVPYSLPNNNPSQIASAIKDWNERNLQVHPYCIDFVSRGGEG